MLLLVSAPDITVATLERGAKVNQFTSELQNRLTYGTEWRPHLYTQVVHLFSEKLPLVYELVLSVEQLHHLLSARLTVLVQLLQSAHKTTSYIAAHHTRHRQIHQNKIQTEITPVFILNCILLTTLAALPVIFQQFIPITNQLRMDFFF